MNSQENVKNATFNKGYSEGWHRGYKQAVAEGEKLQQELYKSQCEELELYQRQADEMMDDAIEYLSLTTDKLEQKVRRLYQAWRAMTVCVFLLTVAVFIIL